MLGYIFLRLSSSSFLIFNVFPFCELYSLFELFPPKSLPVSFLNWLEFTKCPCDSFIHVMVYPGTFAVCAITGYNYSHSSGQGLDRRRSRDPVKVGQLFIRRFTNSPHENLLYIMKNSRSPKLRGSKESCFFFQAKENIKLNINCVYVVLFYCYVKYLPGFWRRKFLTNSFSAASSKTTIVMPFMLQV